MNATEDFLEAVKAGDTTRVGALLHDEPTLAREARSESGVSAFMLAVYCGHSEIVNLFIDEAIELNVFEATAGGQTGSVEALIDADPAVVNQFSPDGFTLLTLAAFFGRKEIMELLLMRGADPNIASNNAMGVRPLNSAMAHRQPDVALAMGEMLLDHGADPNYAQAGGWRPLHEAAAHGHADKAKLLLSHGAEVNVRSEDSRTPLQMALAANHQQAADILRQHGAHDDA